jgi:hypothetical protein
VFERLSGGDSEGDVVETVPSRVEVVGRPTVVLDETDAVPATREAHDAAAAFLSLLPEQFDETEHPGVPPGARIAVSNGQRNVMNPDQLRHASSMAHHSHTIWHHWCSGRQSAAGRLRPSLDR